MVQPTSRLIMKDCQPSKVILIEVRVPVYSKQGILLFSPCPWLLPVRHLCAI